MDARKQTVLQMPSGYVYFKVPVYASEIDANFAMLATTGVDTQSFKQKLGEIRKEKR